MPQRSLPLHHPAPRRPGAPAPRRDVPYTDNCRERALRPSVIFRQVTGCFRSHWGARLYAAAASVIATGRLNQKSALQAINHVIAGQRILATP